MQSVVRNPAFIAATTAALGAVLAYAAVASITSNYTTVTQITQTGLFGLVIGAVLALGAIASFWWSVSATLVVTARFVGVGSTLGSICLRTVQRVGPRSLRTAALTITATSLVFGALPANALPTSSLLPPSISLPAEVLLSPLNGHPKSGAIDSKKAAVHNSNRLGFPTDQPAPLESSNSLESVDHPSETQDSLGLENATDQGSGEPRSASGTQTDRDAFTKTFTLGLLQESAADPSNSGSIGPETVKTLQSATTDGTEGVNQTPTNGSANAHASPEAPATTPASSDDEDHQEQHRRAKNSTSGDAVLNSTPHSSIRDSGTTQSASTKSGQARPRSFTHSTFDSPLVLSLLREQRPVETTAATASSLRSDTVTHSRAKTDTNSKTDVSRKTDTSSKANASARGSVTVRDGDNLWDIAQALLPLDVTAPEIAQAWQEIYEANKKTIGKDPNILYAGTELRIPDLLRN